MFSFTTNVSGINLYKEIKAMRNKDEHTINLLQKKMDGMRDEQLKNLELKKKMFMVFLLI